MKYTTNLVYQPIKQSHSMIFYLCFNAIRISNGATINSHNNNNSNKIGSHKYWLGNLRVKMMNTRLVHWMNTWLLICMPLIQVCVPLIPVFRRTITSFALEMSFFPPFCFYSFFSGFLSVLFPSLFLCCSFWLGNCTKTNKFQRLYLCFSFHPSICTLSPTPKVPNNVDSNFNWFTFD